MDAKKLLEEIYISKELKDCIAKIKPIDIQQDVLQHSFVELLLKDDDLIIDLQKETNYSLLSQKSYTTWSNGNDQHGNTLNLKKFIME